MPPPIPLSGRVGRVLGGEPVQVRQQLGERGRIASHAASGEVPRDRRLTSATNARTTSVSRTNSDPIVGMIARGMTDSHRMQPNRPEEPAMRELESRSAGAARPRPRRARRRRRRRPGRAVRRGCVIPPGHALRPARDPHGRGRGIPHRPAAHGARHRPVRRARRRRLWRRRGALLRPRPVARAACRGRGRDPRRRRDPGRARRRPLAVAARPRAPSPGASGRTASRWSTSTPTPTPASYEARRPTARRSTTPSRRPSGRAQHRADRAARRLAGPRRLRVDAGARLPLAHDGRVVERGIAAVVATRSPTLAPRAAHLSHRRHRRARPGVRARHRHGRARRPHDA